MSTLKSSAEHLTLNADGSGNDIKFQSNATEVAAIDQAGNLTLSGTVDGVDIQTLNTAVAANTAKVTNSTSASDLTSGTLPDARFPSTLPAINGSALTNIDAVTISNTVPGSPSQGDLWFNSSGATVSAILSENLGVYNGTSWDQLSNVIFEPTGGTQTTYSGYKVATFTSSGTFTPNVAGTVDVLVVAGGGGGGAGRGAGGGAGGMVYRTGLDVTAQAYTITIGAGGAGALNHSNHAANGADTVAFSVTAKGGGNGGSGVTGTTSISIGETGGSGGGTTHGADGAIASNQGTFSGWTSKGNAGGNGNSSDNESAGGGGGAGAAGQAGDASGNGGDGGIGFQNDYQTGSNQYYGGGGGGGFGADIGATSGNGGNGGGGRGAAGASNTPTGDPIAGTANTGGGGGGGCYTGSFSLTSNQGFAGGSGIVIIRWAT
jgi:hypothetical protein